MRTFYEEWKTLENDNSSVQTDENGLSHNDGIYSLQRINLPDFFD